MILATAVVRDGVRRTPAELAALALDRAGYATAPARRRDRVPPDRPRADRSADPAVPHGTTGGYAYHRCSCAPCRAAARAELAGRRAAARARRVRVGDRLVAPPEAPHGTTTGVTHWGCQCDRCRASLRAYRAGLRS